jgi:hypothetical protein
MQLKDDSLIFQRESVTAFLHEYLKKNFNTHVIRSAILNLPVKV